MLHYNDSIILYINKITNNKICIAIAMSYSTIVDCLRNKGHIIQYSSTVQTVHYCLL